MIEPQKREQVLRLKAQGRGVRWIARHLAISRNSVRDILDPERKKKRAKKKRSQSASEEKQSILEPYKKAIQELLEDDERERKRHPRRKPLTAKKIFKEMRKRGYKGGRTLVDDYVRKIRGPRHLPRPCVRFETAVAEEAQQDWSPYRVPIDGVERVIQLFSLILCWSRYQFLRAYLDQRLPTLLHGHVAAFRYFSGVPWKIVYDQQSTITPFRIAGEPVLTEKFRAFKEHYGFDVYICQPGDPQRKGKVEKPFQAFETGFLPLRKFKSLEDFNTQLLDWLGGVLDPEEGNHRKHRTTGEVPYERWLEEKEYLYGLPATDHLPRRVETRLVHHDATISVDGATYTVPAQLVQRRERQVWVSIGEEDFLVYDKKGELVAQHKLSEEKGRLIIDERHYRELRRLRGAERRPELERKFLERLPGSEEFLRRLKETLRSIAPIHLREILALARRYRGDEVKEALEQALADGSASAGYVRKILSRKHPTGHLGNLHKEPPKGLSLGSVEVGDSQGYAGVFREDQEERRKEDTP